MTTTAKPICFYLPQFHSIPENDRWWGKGFTEWTLTKAAKPLFENHQQPRLPTADLGYYNLLDRRVRRRQGELARAHRIHGFCYYHYWFRGKRLLDRPLALMLEDGYPDLPFCLCWANEPWSRRWAGEDRAVLQPQDYGREPDWDAHFRYLVRFLCHPNYIRVAGKPMLLIYRLGQIPDAESMVARWRQLAGEFDLEGLHMVAVQGGVADNRVAPHFIDAVAEHQPTNLLDRALPIVKDGVSIIPVEQLWALQSEITPIHPVHYSGVCHAWDNTPRRGRSGVVVLPSTPRRYAAYLQTLCRRAASDPALPEPFVFINAWNEWSEGAYLEPDEQYGHDWLNAISDAVDDRAPEFEPLESTLESGIDLSQSRSTRDRLSGRRSAQPDVDFLFAVISQQTRGENVLEFGCEEGTTSEHLRWLLGARRYIGLEPNPTWVGLARSVLGEVHHVHGERLPLEELDIVPGSMEIAVCRDLLAYVDDPLAICTKLVSALRPGGIAALGIPHAGADAIRAILESADGAPVDGEADAPRRFTLAQTQELLEKAGLELLNIFRVFNPKSPAWASLNETDNTLTIGRQRISGLTRKQAMNLACLRLIVFARKRECASASAVTTSLELVSLETFRSRVNRTISPRDPLFPVYERTESPAAYFDGAFAQLQVIDELLCVHTSQRLVELTSIADYACNYGRLLRALRALNPHTDLYAYDIDPQATAFCAQHFGAQACTVGWEPDRENAEALHQLICCISLLTHTDVDFYRRVLNRWARMMAPGALLCFTYLGVDYLDKWLQGDLDHYGAVNPTVRQHKVAEFAAQGHVYAACKTPYSDNDQYGVGFLSESTVRRAVDAQPGLEYLATLPGDQSVFNQDLAIIRRIPT